MTSFNKTTLGSFFRRRIQPHTKTIVVIASLTALTYALHSWHKRALSNAAATAATAKEEQLRDERKKEIEAQYWDKIYKARSRVKGGIIQHRLFTSKPDYQVASTIAKFSSTFRNVCPEIRDLVKVNRKTPTPVSKARQVWKDHNKTHAACQVYHAAVLASRRFFNNTEYSNHVQRERRAANVRVGYQPPTLTPNTAGPSSLPSFMLTPATRPTFGPLENIRDPVVFHQIEHDYHVEVLVREYKYWRMRQIADGKGAYKSGIPRLSDASYVLLQAELAYFTKEKALPMAFMTNARWSDEQARKIKGALAFAATRAKLRERGEWQERSPEERKAAREKKRVEGLKPSTSKVTVVPDAKPSTSVPPVMDPPYKAGSLLAIQKEQEEESRELDDLADYHDPEGYRPCLGDVMAEALEKFDAKGKGRE